MTLLDIVLNHYNVTQKELRLKTRKWYLREPRYLVCWLHYYYSETTIADIGFMIYRDHSTVLAAIDEVNRKVAKSWQMAEAVKEIENKAISAGFKLIFSYGRNITPRDKYTYPTFKLRPPKAVANNTDNVTLLRLRRRTALVEYMGELKQKAATEDSFTKLIHLESKIRRLKGEIIDLL